MYVCMCVCVCASLSVSLTWNINSGIIISDRVRIPPPPRGRGRFWRSLTPSYTAGGGDTGAAVRVVGADAPLPLSLIHI